MLDMIRDMFYLPNVQLFDNYPNVSPQVQAEIDEWKAEFKNYCEGFSDVAQFSAQYYGSDLQSRGTNLITKAAMEAMTGQTQEQARETGYASENAPQKEEDVISVKDFLAQYQAAYTEVKKAGYRKRGEKAYEDVFNVANRTDDMIEAQIILEEERLLYKIVSEDTLDIYETLLEALDPLYEAVSAPLGLLVEVYKKANGDEELTYETERVKRKIPEVTAKSKTLIYLGAKIGVSLLNYASGKKQIREWLNDRYAQEGLGKMVNSRYQIKKYLGMLKEQFDLTFDELIADEFTKLWLLNVQNLDEYGRVKRVLNPENLVAYKEIVEEALSDKSIYEILLTEQKTVVKFALDKADADYQRRAEAKAKELNMQLKYYQYLGDLSSQMKSFIKK